MKNSLEILLTADLRLRVTFVTSDGFSAMELHSLGTKDTDLLVKFSKLEKYRAYPGGWQLTMPHEQKVFSTEKFTDLIAQALAYTYERDNPMDYDYTY